MQFRCMPVDHPDPHPHAETRKLRAYLLQAVPCPYSPPFPRRRGSLQIAQAQFYDGTKGHQETKGKGRGFLRECATL